MENDRTNSRQSDLSHFFDDLTYEDLLFAVEGQSLGDALKNNISHPQSKDGDAVWERTGERPDPEGPSYGIRPSAEVKLRTVNRFDELAEVDYGIDARYREIQQALNNLAKSGKSGELEALTKVGVFIQELQTTTATVSAVVCVGDENASFREALLSRCAMLHEEMKETYAVLERRGGSLYPPAEKFDNTVLDPQLGQKDPITLFAAFIVLVLNVFGSLVRDWSNTALRLQVALLSATYHRLRPNGPTHHETEMLHAFPRDIRTARNLFQLEAQTISYAACPKCSTLYPYSPNSPLPIHCTAQRTPRSPPCNVVISKLGSDSGKAKSMKRVPVRPFVLQDFDAFKASLLNRPGMEGLLDQGTVFNKSRDMWDIKQGTTIRDLKGPDGKPFVDGLMKSELRLMWALSIDWFNPLLNKIAGKTTSSGSIVMSCLNLPPSLRYRTENLYVVGIIPGPKEPSVDDFDHFLEPVVDSLDRSWRFGTKFARTESSPSGRTERSILAVVVADLPGARKITGNASHGSVSFFCSLCKLSKVNINNFDINSWPRRSRAEQKQAAESWRDAPSQADRKRKFEEHGIRWSSLWKLDYFDPTKMVVVDSMHNLFLGLVQFHVREVLGIEAPRSSEALKTTDAERLAAEDAISKGDFKKLQRARLPTLELLCRERGFDLGDRYTRQRAKKPYLLDMLETYIKNGGSLPTQTSSFSPPEATSAIAVELPDIIGLDYVEECQPPDVFIDTVTKSELSRIRQGIKAVTRPQYRRGPPHNLGDPAHGKLKASQWKTAIEFDLPVCIAMLWSREVFCGSRNTVDITRCNALFESIIHLAIAIRWGTSYRTSNLHATKYQQHMQLYLESLINLYPDIQLRPNHHSALHIAEKLLQFGPVQGWWMFPFERVIGKLQQVNTNYKQGELETTMLKSFCAGARLKALIESKDCPKALLPAVSILEHHLQDATLDCDSNLSLGQSTQACFSKDGVHSVTKMLSSSDAENAFRQGFLARSVDIGACSDTVPVEMHKHLNLGGVNFSVSKQSRRDAEISFCPLGEDVWVPGVIESILSMEKDSVKVFILGVRRRQALKPATSVPDPFARFPDFGAEVWSIDLDSAPTYVPLTKPIYHTQSMPWFDRAVVLKAIRPDF